MKFPWQKGFKEERDAQAKALVKAQEDLDALTKSKAEEGEVSAIDELEKALKDFSELDPLQKSEDGDEDDKNGDSDPEEKDDEKEKMEKARLEEIEERLEKARQEGRDEDLVEASIMFEELQKSVEDVTEMTGEGLDLLAKGLGSNTDLLIKTARAVVGLQKSLDVLTGLVGAMPGKGNAPVIGFQKSREEDTGDKTSVDEARNVLQKALETGALDIPFGTLTALDSHKDVGRIPAAVREKYAIKA